MIDFHCHSTASDGSLSPKQLVEKAICCGITHLALTDHDTTDGLDEFLSCKNSNITLIPGIELSVEYTGGQLHIVGLFIDKSSIEMINLIKEVKEYREERNNKLLEKLSKLLKRNITIKDVLKDSKGLLGRPHIAKYLVNMGVVSTMQDAFNNYLCEGMILYAPKTQIPVEKAINTIKNSGGISILAHPVSLKLDDNDLDKRISYYKNIGLDGIEVFSSKSPDEKKSMYLSLAKKHNLIVSCGSDYHGSNGKVLSLGADIGSYKKEDILRNMFKLIDNRKSM